MTLNKEIWPEVTKKRKPKKRATPKRPKKSKKRENIKFTKKKAPMNGACGGK